VKRNPAIPYLVAATLSLLIMTSAQAETATGSSPYTSSAVKHFNSAVDLSNSGNFKQAIAEYKRAISSDARMEEAYSNLGAVYCEEGDYESAVSAFAQALTIKPDRTRTLNALGSALYALGRIPEAKQAWGRTIGIDPKCTAAIYNLGRAFENESDYAGAFVAYSRALRLDPETADVRERLAEICKHSNITDVQAYIAELNKDAPPEPPQTEATESATNISESAVDVSLSAPATYASGVELASYSHQDDTFQSAFSDPNAMQFQDHRAVASTSSVEFVSDMSMSHAHRQFSSAINKSMSNGAKVMPQSAKAPLKIAAAMKPSSEQSPSEKRDFDMFVHMPH
jgi:tetratricopeptide (TPR) repeat protein